MGVRVVSGSDGLVEHGAGLIDGAFDAGFDYRLAGEAFAVAHADVRGEDDRIGRVDRGLGDRLIIRRALRLNGQRYVIALGRGLGEGVGRHVGVGDAGGAGGDGHDAGDIGRRFCVGRGCGRGRGGGGAGGAGGSGTGCGSAGSSALGCRFLGWLLLRLFGVDYVQHKPDDFFLGGGVAQGLEEVLAY